MRLTPPLLRLGCVKYLNALPLIHGWPGEVEFDHPSVLCRKLAAGELEAALVSSFEYLRRPIYRIVDDVCVASPGPVYSVVLTNPGSLRAAEEIAVDPASETSVALLRCLLFQRNLHPTFVPATGQPPSSRPRVELLIGDQAMHFRQKFPDVPIMDLAEEWNAITHLPFVFALWLVRPEVTNAGRIARALRELRDQNVKRLVEIAAHQSQFTPQLAERYLSENLSYVLGPREKQGLQEFHRRCGASGMEVPAGVTFNFV